MDESKLIEVATTAVIGTLTKAAAEPALAAGRKVWDWIKRKTTGTETQTVAAVEADPAKPSAPAKITALLQDLLHDNKEAAEHLRRLLGGDIQTITQTANVTGNNNKLAQTAGSGNTTRIG